MAMRMPMMTMRMTVVLISTVMLVAGVWFALAAVLPVLVPLRLPVIVRIRWRHVYRIRRRSALVHVCKSRLVWR